MQAWKRRTIGILSLGGGAIGVAMATQVLLARSNPLEWVLCIVFAAIYAWGSWQGLRLIESNHRALGPLVLFWAIQVPTFSSPLAGYFLASGFHATVALQFTSLTQLNFAANALMGSTFTYSLLQTGTPWSVGVNVFALAVAIWLFRWWRFMRQRPAEDAEATATHATAQDA